MAINTRIVNGSHTEIYVGEGNFITQAAPTNFHRFWSSKILAADESADLFVEVTAARRAQLEQSDAAWVRPPQCFIDQWNAAAGSYGCYNEATGFFELNGLKDITYAEAMEIYAVSAGWGANCSDSHPELTAKLFSGFQGRTLLPARYQTEWVRMDNMFNGCPNLEAIRITRTGSIIPYRSVYAIFRNCTKLKRVFDEIHYLEDNNTFQGCKALEDVRLRVSGSIRFADSPRLSIESIEYMVNNNLATKAITITLHPDAYARVTDDIFAAAAAKNITIATP